jgi:hypothetical protein
MQNSRSSLPGVASSAASPNKAPKSNPTTGYCQVKLLAFGLAVVLCQTDAK